MFNSNKAFNVINNLDIIHYENLSIYKLFFLRNLFVNTTFERLSKSKTLKSKYMLVWGSSFVDKYSLSKKGLTIIRFEDGFIRSVGLGAGLISPSSWVFDMGGIYYDNSSKSDLIKLIEESDLKPDDDEYNSVLKIREKIIEFNISKYNIKNIKKLNISTNKKVILAIGQVEDDKAIKKGSLFFKNNVSFIKAVREINKDAIIVYKPHPDTVKNLRRHDSNSEKIKKLVDIIHDDGDAVGLFDKVDEVHVINSLVGFEALIRNKKVHCYGQPFYANFGLTYDYNFDFDLNLIEIKDPCSHLLKKSLEELIFAVLIKYPIYFQDHGKILVSIDRVINSLNTLKQRKYQDFLLNLRYKVYSTLKSLFKNG